jgi:glycosyltransferase involved in cell wall biosynthesis
MWKPRKGGVVTHVENLMRYSRNEFTIVSYERFIDAPVLRALSFLVYGLWKGLREEFDLIHAHYALPQGLLGVLLRKMVRKPLVITIHGSDLTVLGRNPFTRPLIAVVLKNADMVISVSDYLRKEALELGIPPDKIKTIPGGAPEIVLKKEGQKDSITYIGSLVRQKGVDILIEAFREVKKAFPAVKLRIVGNGVERKRLERQAESIEDIYFLGSRDDLSEVLEKSLLLVLPSREEGFGLVLLEAMAAGIPIVATNVGGIPEIVEDQVSGILVEKENPKELASGILAVLENGMLRQKLIRGGRKVARRYSWENMAYEVDRVYEEVSSP